MVVREGHRITQVDLDRETAAALGRHVSAWAAAQDAPEGGR
jgi:hypothetical protein